MFEQQWNTRIANYAKFGKWVRNARRISKLDAWVDVGYLWCIIRGYFKK